MAAEKISRHVADADTTQMQDVCPGRYGESEDSFNATGNAGYPPKSWSRQRWEIRLGPVLD